MLTSASLFSGGGGADIGLELAGFKSIWGIERDEKIAQYAQLNLPNSNIINAAIQDINPRELPAPDLLWMSPPCQQYSNARRGTKNDHQDKDAGLYCLSFIETLKPRWIILENVPGYASSDPFNQILSCLKSNGYHYHWLILNAADYGVPQNRKRLIMWASRDKLPFFPQSKKRVGWYEAIAHLILSLPDSKLAGWQVKRLEEVKHKLSGINLVDIGKDTSRSHAPVVLMPRDGANIKNCLPSLSGEPCPTIRAMSGRHTHWADVVDFREQTVKQITPVASALLQSFPPDYLLPEVKTLAQKIIGNAVPPLLAKELGMAIVKTNFGG